jgi:hypothetical protein
MELGAKIYVAGHTGLVGSAIVGIWNQEAIGILSEKILKIWTYVVKETLKIFLK